MATVTFAGATASHSALEDVDGDSDLDLVLHFSLGETHLVELYTDLIRDDFSDGTLEDNHQQTEIALTGFTTDGEAFLGADELAMFFTGRALRDLLSEL